MITQSHDLRIDEELILDKDILCTQLKAGNPFSSNQDIAFNKENTTEDYKNNLCSIDSRIDLNDKAISFFKQGLESSFNRAERFPKEPAIINAIALEYLRMGDIKNAINEFKNVLSLDKNYFPALANLAKCYSIKHDFDTALSIYDDLHKKNYKEIDVLVNIALLHIQKHEYDAAFSFLKKAKAIDPKNNAILNNIGLLYLLKYDFKSAISELKEACRNQSNDPLIYNNIGVCFVALKNYRKAINNFNIAHSLDRDNRGVVKNLVNAYQKINEHEKVIDLITDFLIIHPDDIELKNSMALSLFKLGNYSKCLHELSFALIDDRNKDKKIVTAILNNIGVVYNRLGDMTKAKEYLIKGLETDAEPNKLVLRNLIHVCFKANWINEAKKYIDDALVAFDNDPVFLSYLGDYHSHVGDYHVAKDIYNKVLSIDPKAIMAYVGLGLIMTEVDDDIDNALRLLEKGLSYHKGDSHLINNYAYTLILKGNLEDARLILDKLKIEDSVYITATRGLLLIREGNVEEGRRLYNKAIALAGSNHDLARLADQKKHLELARHYIQKGEGREAIRLLKKGMVFKTREKYYRERISKLLGQIMGQ